MQTPLAASLSLCLVAACATPAPAPTIRPLVARAELEVAYSARVGDAGKLSDGISFQAAEFEPGVGAIEVGCRVVELDRRTAEAMFERVPPGPFALTVERDDAERALEMLLADSDAALISAPSLALSDGQSGWITVLNQTAYISDFEIETAEGVLIADPIIGVVEGGLLLAVTPRLTTVRIEEFERTLVTLDVSLEFSSLELPFAEIEVSIVGGAAPVTLQRPLATSQKLGAELRLTRDDCVVLGTILTDDDDRFVYAFLTAEPISLDELADIEATLHLDAARPTEPPDLTPHETREGFIERISSDG